MAHEDFKCLPKTTTSDKVLHDKAFNTAKRQNMMDINVDLLHLFTHFVINSHLVQKRLVVPFCK